MGEGVVGERARESERERERERERGSETIVFVTKENQPNRNFLALCITMTTHTLSLK